MFQYIPRYINPSNRRWRAGEEVILRINLGYWRLALVYSNEQPKFSTNWNRIVKENRITFTNILIFNLVEEDEKECVFDIEEGKYLTECSCIGGRYGC